VSKSLRSVLALGVLLGCLAAAPAGASHSPKDNDCYRFNESETDLARRINQARKRNDLGKMHHDPELSKVARVNAKKMAKQGYLTHTLMKRLSERVTREVTLGEAVVVAGTTKKSMRLLMGSPPHRALILDSFRHFGVGVVGKKGDLWTTIVFSGRKNPGTTLDMPDC
jgi:uncharacterized protein YkwD